MYRRFLFFSIILMNAPQLQAGATLLFVPFEDDAHLRVEAWNLKYDIPEWFSSTLDTIGGNDGLIDIIPFDTVRSTVSGSGWQTGEMIKAPRVVRLCTSLGADYLVYGRVKSLKSQTRGRNTDANFQAGHEIGKQTTGFGGGRVMAGLHSYEASVEISVRVFEGSTGKEVLSKILDSETKDGGLNVWLPIKSQNPELDYHEMTNHPFGSEYFQRTILGSIMARFSYELRDDFLRMHRSKASMPAEIEKQYLEGRILEQVGRDVYINLGTKDDLFVGERFNVMKPIRPIRGETGDTLGWVEEPVCAIRVLYIKSDHFSQAILDTCFGAENELKAGWSVRSVTEE